MRFAHVLLFAAALVCLLPLSSAAVRHHVPSATYPTIQSAINVATFGAPDTVMVAPGIYSPTTNGEVFPLDLRYGCTLLSSGGAGATTIDAMGTARAVTCTLAMAVVDGFTITGGHAFGIAPDDFGGGIYARWSGLWMTNCVITGNTADYEGGGMWAKNSTLDIKDCTFSSNDGEKGGGMAVSFCDPVWLERVDFLDNVALEHGGGIACFDSSLDAFYCLLARNSVTDPFGDGGGATTMGGDAVTFANCTFADNSAINQGSGLMDYGFLSNLHESIFAFNQGAEAIGGNIAYVGCTDIFGNPGGDWTANLATWYPGLNNFSADPLFCYALNPGDPYSIDLNSPCTMIYSPCAVPVGARGVGCGASPVKDSSWGVIKSMYR